MQRPDPLTRAAFLEAALTQVSKPLYDFLSHTPLFLQTHSPQRQTSRHFSVPDLFFNVLYEVNFRVMGDVLVDTGKSSNTGPRHPSD